MSKLKLGMVGGGQGAFIGSVHRIASRIDDHYELVAGSLASNPEVAHASADVRAHVSAAIPEFCLPSSVLRRPDYNRILAFKEVSLMKDFDVWTFRT